MKSSDDGDHLDRNPVVLHQPPQNLPADTIEGLFEIYEVDIQEDCHSDVLLHNNPQFCNLIRTASASLEACLVLSQVFILRDLDALQDHSAKHLTCHVQQHDATPVFTVAQITFLGQFD